ncbi:hypothetical protein [Sorangium sp. So ce1078]|uniref:hypothetical protein n=1 Tax=Sorangium sp. So ce1078 TaxID=3133329 RepID=UPI003F61FAAF
MSPTVKVTAARRWLIVMSLSVTAANLLFFIMAPSLGYPMEYPENVRIMQLLMPVVLGYLGAMTSFLFQAPRRVRIDPQALPFLDLLVKGPVIIFTVATTAAIVAFGYSNRRFAPSGTTRMTLDTLSITITACLALLTVTTNAVVSYLFNASGDGDAEGAAAAGAAAAGGDP